MNNKTAVKVVQNYLHDNIPNIVGIKTQDPLEPKFEINFKPLYSHHKKSVLELTLEIQMDYREADFIRLLNRHNIALRLKLSRYVKIMTTEILVHHSYVPGLAIEKFDRSININRPQASQPE